MLKAVMGRINAVPFSSPGLWLKTTGFRTFSWQQLLDVAAPLRRYLSSKGMKQVLIDGLLFTMANFPIQAQTVRKPACEDSANPRKGKLRNKSKLSVL